MENDPLADVAIPSSTHRPALREPGATSKCGRLDCLDGFLPVSEEWAVERSRGDPVRYASALNSVVPCPDDNPVVYQRWLEGHYEFGHACDECAPHRRSKHR